ncbi:TOBE domain-containing protein [Grimontia marina]|uniref:TOBE domain-containing protein n=1 Tax=Grimontia marina TaxID=646534 RepID=UPI0027B92093|nr:TOBE domain-containing protein [Grimontia marina]
MRDRRGRIWAGRRQGRGLSTYSFATQLGIRPEAINLVSPQEGNCQGIVDVTEYLGADIYVVVDCGELGNITVRTDGESEVRAGDNVGLQFHTNKLPFFDAEGLSVAQS